MAPAARRSLLRHPHTSFERACWQLGCRRVAGIDEAGRGALAGPVVAAAVVLPPDFDDPDLADSKRVPRGKRELLAARLREVATWSLGVVSPHDIDELNILRATHRAMRAAAAALDPPPDFLLIDGLPVPGLDWPARFVVGGDAVCASIAAASVIAKVARDEMMAQYDDPFPQYGFAQNRGYGTRAHREALLAYGPCEIHRRSFGPVARSMMPRLDV